MKIIRNNIIPFSGYNAINLFGVLFVRGSGIISKKTMNHENIHTAQIKEMLYVFFYVWYVIEWFIRLFAFKGTKYAYRNISFEREAYSNQGNAEYLSTRRLYSFMKYLRINV